MDLPEAPSLLPEPRKKDEQTKESIESPSVNEGDDYTMGDKSVDESKVEGFQNGKDESSRCRANVLNENNMGTDEKEVSKVKKDDIVAQVLTI